MRKKNFSPDAPAMILALKLCEEAAEVGTEITDAWNEAQVVADDPARVKRIHAELDHVQHLVDTLRTKFPKKKA